MTQTDFDKTINVLFAKINDTFDKQHKELESMNALIANQDVKVDDRIEKQVQTLSVLVKEISYKYSEI